jgi:hypothetical protein
MRKKLTAGALFIAICLFTFLAGGCKDLLHPEGPSVPDKPSVYSITVNAASNGNITADPASAAAGTTITLTVSADADYQLKILTIKNASGADVAVNGTGASRTFTMPASNVTVSAVFEKVPPNTYSVTVNAASNGNITADPASAVAGTTITLTVSADADYQLKILTIKNASGADVDVAGTGTTRTFTMPASNVAVSAVFEQLPPNFYSVTVNTVSNGKITANPANAVAGTSVTLTASADADWYLKILTVKDASNADVALIGTGTSRTFTMPASNVTVSAVFEEVPEYGLFVQDGANISFVSGVTSPFNIVNALYWLAKNAQANTAYSIVINTDETLGPAVLSQANLNGKTGVRITLRGFAAERTIELASNGSLFTVGSGVTLNLGENISLKGLSDNNTSLIRINSSATLTMTQGAKISGNASSSGGGVYVSGGTFTMNGGKISGNTSFSYGGGVYVASGTFTMNTGEISGNIVTSPSSASSSGGGVYVVSNSTFIMNGGEISGNSVSFSSSYNISSYGGGVYVSSSAFTMSGGEISGNTASFTSSYYPSYGGGVYVSGGTFIKLPVSGNTTSGVIYGYTANDAKSNKVTNSNGTVQDNKGHAVYIDSSSVKKRETTAGETRHLDSTVSGAAGGWE